MIEAIIFDAWGTVFQNAANISPLTLMNHYLNKTFHNKEYLTAFEEVTALDASDNLELESCALLDRINVPRDDGNHISIVTNFLKQAFMGKIAIFEDAAEIVPRLKKHYKIGLLSNCGLASANNLRTQFPLTEMFDQLLFSYQVGVLKPDKIIFHHMLKIMGIERAHNAIFIGDHPVIDCWGASMAGLKTILIDRKNQNLSLPLKRCQSLTELESLILEY